MTKFNDRTPDENGLIPSRGLIPFRDDGARAYAILTVEACRERIAWLEEQMADGYPGLEPALEDAYQNLEEALARETLVEKDR